MPVSLRGARSLQPEYASSQFPSGRGATDIETGRESGGANSDEQENRETFNMWYPARRKRNIKLAAAYRQMSPGDYIWEIIRPTVARDLDAMTWDLRNDADLQEDRLLPE